jgi:hypothetical protein
MTTFRNARAVTPSDTAGLGLTSNAISIGVAGTITVDMAGGAKDVTLTLPAGLFEIAVTKIYATDTTATGIAVFWL